MINKNRNDKDPARHHRKSRQERSLEITEDYVEAVAELLDQKGEARVVDIAKSLGVSHVTVNRTLKRLMNAGLVTSEKYRSVFLTKEGERIAKAVRHKHKVVIAFLEALGVPSEIASSDAEGIEHHISKQTLAAFERFIGKGK